ncbi:MAG: DUF4003 family protein [Acidobacteriota bacterium]|nr:DUF4003 family protein [Acidobacteriota bacterium]
MDAIDRYFAVFDGLLRGKRWSTDTNMLRLAALTAMSCEGGGAVARSRAVAARLGRKPSPLRSMNAGLRLAIGAMLVRRDVEVEAAIAGIERGLELFRRHRLKRHGSHPRLAALILVLEQGGDGVSEQAVERMAAIMARWKKDHFFLTGIDDYLMAALHASRTGTPLALGRRVEAIYQALHREGMRRGNQLQLASHLLALSSRGAEVTARSFGTWARALRERGQRVGSGQYDEVALLALSGARVDAGATRVVTLRDALRARKPRPGAALAFSIATGLLISERIARSDGGAGAPAAANLRAIQSLVEAQQAAAIAAISAVTAATATAG